MQNVSATINVDVKQTRRRAREEHDVCVACAMYYVLLFPQFMGSRMGGAGVDYFKRHPASVDFVFNLTRRGLCAFSVALVRSSRHAFDSINFDLLEKRTTFCTVLVFMCKGRVGVIVLTSKIEPPHRQYNVKYFTVVKAHGIS